MIFEEIQPIILGTTPNDGTGDKIRVGGGKINSNFTELDKRTRACAYGKLTLFMKGNQDGVANEGLNAEKGDIFRGQISASTVYLAALWKGNDLDDVEDFIPILQVEIDEENRQ